MRILFLFLATFLFGNEKLLIAKFEGIKPFYYQNQIVSLKLEILTAKDGKIRVFDDSNKSYEVLPLNDNGEYISNINFQLVDKLPKFSVFFEDKNITDEVNLTINSKIQHLYPPKNFSNIIAKGIKVSDKVLTNYDEHSNIVYLTINAYGGYSDDFTLHLQDEKLYFLDKNDTFSSYSYSALVPIDKHNFKFSYFNLKDNTYHNISFGIKLKNELVSTQTDIKPLATNNLIIIDILLGLLLIIWLLFYFYRRKVIYIILIVLNIAILVFMNLPKKDIVIPANTKIHILPFDKSTIFLVTTKAEKVKVLDEKNNYKKIEYNKYIGWIKDE